MKDTPEFQKLVIDLTGLSPEDAFSPVPYNKGQCFLRYLEDLFGGPSVFEPFFRFYLEKYKYKSVVTEDFKRTLHDYFNGKADDKLAQIDWNTWLYAAGPAKIVPNYDTSYIDAVHKQVNIWIENPVEKIKNHPDIDTTLIVHQKIEMLMQFVKNPGEFEITEEWITLLETTYGFIGTRNSAYLARLARLYVKGRLNRLDQVFKFLNSNSVMSYVRPIYRDLAKWPQAKPLAIENFKKTLPQMMKVCAQMVARDLDIAIDF